MGILPNVHSLLHDEYCRQQAAGSSTLIRETTNATAAAGMHPDRRSGAVAERTTAHAGAARPLVRADGTGPTAR